MENNESSILATFTFLITVNIILTTAIMFFADTQTFLDKYQIIISDWFFVPIISLILSFVCFQIVREKLSKKDLAHTHKWLLVSLVLNAFLFFSSKYPMFITPYFVLTIPAIIAFNFGIILIEILIPLVWKIFKK
jgi:phosphate/sulfate permease